MSSPRQRPTGDLVYSYLPEASFVMLKGKYKHDAQIIIKKKSLLYIELCSAVNRCLYLQAGSDTAVWEDLRELRDEADGVRLWSNRSKASFKLKVLSWDSEPESWDCCKQCIVTRSLLLSTSLIFTNHTSCWSDLLNGDLRWWFFNSQLSALFCSYFSITEEQRQLMTQS